MNDEMLREVMEHPDVKEANSVDFIPLKRGSLPRVKPGMYWYSDDTVSEAFSKEKKLKSLVLFVRNNVVFGDTFEQRYCVEGNLNSYVGELRDLSLAQYGFGLIHRPCAEDLQEVYQHFQRINSQLSQAKKLKWSNDLFWARSEKAISSIVDMLDGDEMGYNTKKTFAYFRGMISQVIK